MCCCNSRWSLPLSVPLRSYNLPLCPCHRHNVSNAQLKDLLLVSLAKWRDVDWRRWVYIAARCLYARNVICCILLLNTLLLHFAWDVAEAKCIVVTAVCVCVCLSVPRRIPTLLHGPGCNLGTPLPFGKGCPLVVHYWADLRLVHGFRCYDHIVLVLALCLVLLASIYDNFILLKMLPMYVWTLSVNERWLFLH